MGSGYIELEFSALLEEALDELEKGTSAHGIALKVLDEDTTANLSPNQLYWWNSMVVPAINRVENRHQRWRFENTD